jgi:chromosome partitioning protein
MIIAFVAQKGGTGKTTLAVNVAVCSLDKNRCTALVDLDPQASASLWASRRASVEPDGLISEVCHPPLLARTLERLRARGATLSVLDTPPQNATAATHAAATADLVVIPVRPSAFDLAAVVDTVNLVKAAHKPALIVINAVPAGSNVGEEAQAALCEYGLPIVGRVGQRIIFQHAAAQGRGVIEMAPNSRASEEIRAMCTHILGRRSR